MRPRAVPRDSVFMKFDKPLKYPSFKFISSELSKNFAKIWNFWSKIVIFIKNETVFKPKCTLLIKKSSSFLSYLQTYISNCKFLSITWPLDQSCDQEKSCSIMFKYSSWFKWTFFDVIPFSAISPDFKAFVDSGFYIIDGTKITVLRK